MVHTANAVLMAAGSRAAACGVINGVMVSR